MTISASYFTHGRDGRGRTAWWYYGRGLVLFVPAFGLSYLGHVKNWRWLEFTASCVGVIAVGMVWRGVWLAYRVRRARYWEWFDEQRVGNIQKVEPSQRPPSTPGPL